MFISIMPLSVVMPIPSQLIPGRAASLFRGGCQVILLNFFLQRELPFSVWTSLTNDFASIRGK